MDSQLRHENSPVVQRLANNGITVLVDSQHKIAHNKIMIVDGTTTWTGSYNFTNTAETLNAENMVSIEDPDIAAIYAKNSAPPRVALDPLAMIKKKPGALPREPGFFSRKHDE